MDYGELLLRAQENSINTNKKDVRCYKTTFCPSQKLVRSYKVSSVNIKKFIARREDEKRKKLEELTRKREGLGALRSLDKKAQRRVQVMLKSTKLANKSVMEDAIDNFNTADTLGGLKQCDEDDYGYVSQEASAFYDKLLRKYQTISAGPSNFQTAKSEMKDLNATKDRVRAALQKKAEEQMMPHFRNRRKSDSKEIEIADKNQHFEIKSEDTDVESTKALSKPKPNRRQPPPVLSFEQLLLVAEKKQFEPIVIDESLLKKEPKRLMTNKEKLEYEEEVENKLKKGKRPLLRDVSLKDGPPKRKYCLLNT